MFVNLLYYIAGRGRSCDYNNSIGMKMTPAQKQVFDAMRRHGFLTDDYYDLTKQREKVKKEREEKEQAQKS